MDTKIYLSELTLNLLCSQVNIDISRLYLRIPPVSTLEIARQSLALLVLITTGSVSFVRMIGSTAKSSLASRL